MKDEGDTSLINAISQSDELEIFDTLAVRMMIDFKWEQYAKGIHMMGCIQHVIYLTMIIINICNTFLRENSSAKLSDDFKVPIPRQWLLNLMAVNLLYPLYYDGLQCIK